MNKYKSDMDKKNERYRQKAMKKWKKKFPNRPIEEFTYSEVSANESFFASEYSSSSTMAGGFGAMPQGKTIVDNTNMFGQAYRDEDESANFAQSSDTESLSNSKYGINK